MKYLEELSLAPTHTSSKAIPHLTILHCLVFKEQPSASQAPAFAGVPAYESRLVAGGSCKYTTSGQTMQPSIWRFGSICADLRHYTSATLTHSHPRSGLWGNLLFSAPSRTRHGRITRGGTGSAWCPARSLRPMSVFTWDHLWSPAQRSLGPVPMLVLILMISMLVFCVAFDSRQLPSAAPVRLRVPEHL